ncbi:hypothetical protein B9Z19DRAFT_1074334 [Tuber borchii]|uniref:Uncharacterized protein n=1 Tax=Tuber borchii TaxID=42251 RepID=A0A2T7A4Y3_TUBBO|nr:hypothetical protein B9Z19DRAFT_1074334 [Tuber borchii]
MFRLSRQTKILSPAFIQSSNTMFRLSRQTKILSPALIHQRIWSRAFHDELIPDSTGNDGTEYDGEPKVKAASGVGSKMGAGGGGFGGSSDLFWDRINRLEDKVDGSIKNNSNFQVDVIKSIGELRNELKQFIHDGNDKVHQDFTKIRKEFAGFSSTLEVVKWQLGVLFIGASSLVIWSLKDYIQLRYPAFFPLFPSEEETPHEQPEAPQKKQK